MARNEKHLRRHGRDNAASSSRQSENVEFDNEDEFDNDGEEGDDRDGAMSTVSRFSHAPSLHPSMRSAAVSEACSTVTIGAGDNTQYWDFQHRVVVKNDLGHQVRPSVAERRDRLEKSGLTMHALAPAARNEWLGDACARPSGSKQVA